LLYLSLLLQSILYFMLIDLGGCFLYDTYHIIIPIYGGNFILSLFSKLFILYILMIKYTKYFRSIKLYYYIGIITFCMVISSYMLHQMYNICMSKAFESFLYIVFYFCFYYIINLIASTLYIRFCYSK